MRVLCTVVAAVWLAVAVVASGADGSCPGNHTDRCCPSLFKVDPHPRDFQFRCEVANLTEGCDNVTMSETVANTNINTHGKMATCNNTFLMYDPNWEKKKNYQENIACAYYLPPLRECSWELTLVKPLDPIVCGNNCECDCEDSVSFEKVYNRTGSTDKKTYCDFNSTTGWCGNSSGPHNVQGTLPFRTNENTGVLTTFRSDNINGTGEGAMVFAWAKPVQRKRKRSRNPRQYNHCEYKNQTCNIPCECYNDDEQRISCTLYEIFTDESGRTANQTCRSYDEVIKRAAGHAMKNMEEFGRVVPTYSQLMSAHGEVNTTMNITIQ